MFWLVGFLFQIYQVAIVLLLLSCQSFTPRDQKLRAKYTHECEIANDASTKHPTAVINGAFCVPARSATPCAASPATIATTEFRVVISPKMSFREPPASSRC